MTLLISLISCTEFKVHKRKLIKLENCYEHENGFTCDVLCSGHDYDLNSPRRVSESIYLNPNDCTDTVGFSVDAWAEDITPTIKALKKQHKRR